MEDKLLTHKIIKLPAHKVENLPPANKSEAKKYVNKATQTLFKTLSQNNYRLQEMIDRKANILISVNAIILSLLLGGGLFGSSALIIDKSILILLTVTCSISILLALIAVKPFLINSSSSKMEGQ